MGTRKQKHEQRVAYVAALLEAGRPVPAGFEDVEREARLSLLSAAIQQDQPSGAVGDPLADAEVPAGVQPPAVHAALPPVVHAALDASHDREAPVANDNEDLVVLQMSKDPAVNRRVFPELAAIMDEVRRYCPDARVVEVTVPRSQASELSSALAS
jgi:hypothetical protein